jgi:hypothetical protein
MLLVDLYQTGTPAWALISSLPWTQLPRNTDPNL